jgi:hypothetical protein
MYLVSVNMTTNEQVKKQFKGVVNPYNRGFFDSIKSTFCAPKMSRNEHIKQELRIIKTSNKIAVKDENPAPT